MANRANATSKSHGTHAITAKTPPSLRYAGLLLGSITLLIAACEQEQIQPSRSGRGKTSGNEPADTDDGKPVGSPEKPYDPETPTNTGPAVNPDGYAALVPLMQAHCTECHHAGTWLNLASSLDAPTADKVLETLTKGTMPPAPRAKLSQADIDKVKAWRDRKNVPPSEAPAPPSSTPVTQILSAGTLAEYKAALPKVGFERLGQILESPSTLYWDKIVMPGAYQDTVGDGGNLPFGARLNSTGKSLIVPQGKKLFSDDGKAWAFPFGHTAGTDDSASVRIVNFMSLPTEGGKTLPVAYRIDSGNQGGFPTTRWNWAFPKGTVIGEIIMLETSQGLRTTEIRVRERYEDKWATNAFRPFPTAKTLSAGIKRLRPNWQGVPALKSAVDALENDGTLQAKTIGSPAFNNLVTLEGAVDAPLPDFADDALSTELLKSTTFVSVYGTPWKMSGAMKAFGPTGHASRATIVPNRFDSGTLEVRENTCEKCHNQGGYFIGDLVDQAVLYGDIWGVDRIFSFHPFEPSRIDASGNENRQVRAAFAGSVVERYDAGKHPSSRYTFYRPQK
jgi:hypothetical protein